MDEQRAWIRSRRRKRLRIVAVILCMCLLATTHSDILTTLSALASEWKDGTVYVSGFGELPEAVRAQTVPVGTGIEGLSLPDTLEAFAETPEDEDPSGDADGEDADKPGEAEDGEENQPEDGAGEPGDGIGDAGNAGEGSGDGAGDAGNMDDGTGGAGESGEGNDDGTGDAGNAGGGSGDGTGDAGNAGEGNGDGTGDAGNVDEGTGGAGEPGGGSGDAGNAGEGSGGVSGDAGNAENVIDGVSDDAGNTDEGNNGEEEPESQSDSAPADDEGGAEATDEIAKEDGGALTVRRGVFIMPVYLSEPEASAEPQTMERKEESVMIKGVTWQSEPTYDGSVEGTYVFTAVLPEGYALLEGVALPQITVTVQGTDPVVQELLARIAALPEAEAYLAGEPGVEEKDEYEAWMDELSAYTEEALGLWEMYETLTEEQRAQVPTEALVKLAAWVELAGQLAEGSQVMVAADADGWTAIADSDLLWKLDGGKLTIKGSGDMPNWSNQTGQTPPWYDSRSTIKEVVIENGVTSIGNFAFQSCTLTSMEVPDGVTRIGSFAFWSCHSLTSVTIPESVSSFGTGVFQGCGKLNNVTIPKNVTAISDNLFASCSGLTNVTIPQGVTSIGRSAFSGCSGLTSLMIPVTVTSIGDSAFSDCSGLINLVIPGNMTSIGSHAFSGCSKLQSMMIPAYVTTLENYLFNDCSALTEVIILGNVAKIGDTSIFGGCTSLASVEFKGTTIPKLCKNCFADSPCVAGTAKGLVIPTCKYLTDSSWSQYQDHVSRSHTLTHTAEVPATCEATGTKEYWTCSECNTKFSDAAGTTVITAPVTIPATGHNLQYQAYDENGMIKESCSNSGCDHESTVLFATKQNAPYTFTGSEIEPYKVVRSGETWRGTTSPSISYENNVEVGKATATLSAGGKSVSKTFDIVQKSLEDASVRVSLSTNSPTYTGSAITPTAIVDDGGRRLTVGTDYTVSYQNNTEVSTNDSKANAVITGKGNYAGTRTVPFTIYPRYLTSAVVTLDADSRQYIGEAIEPAVTEVTVGGRKLTPDTDYTVSYNNNINVGSNAQVIITGTGSYKGTCTKTFEIEPKPLTDAMVTMTSTSYSYTGNAITPAVTVKDGSMTLTKGTDYTVSCQNNTDVSTTARVTITGTGNYAGTLTKTFTITAKPLTDASITATLPSDSYPYTGNAITPEVTVKDGSRTLAKDTDYTVAYADNTATGTNTAKVTVTGTGNYTGVRTLTFTIQDKAPEVPEDNLDIDYSGGNITLPDDIKDEVEIYDSKGNKIEPNEDGSLPVEPGTTITIKYPGSDKETEVQIPPRPAAPAPVDQGKIEKTDTTIKAPKPDDGAAYEYVIVEKGEEPDWSRSNTTGEFTGLAPNKEYDLYMRKPATEDSFASEPVKTEIRTSVTVKEPETGGAGAGKPGNDVSGGKPSADGGSVTYTGTCEEGSTPVITVDGEEIVPEITWDADGKKGTWSYTVPVKDGDSEVGITVEFKDRVYKGLAIEPGSLRIHADNAANGSADALIDYLRAKCAVKLTYDNGASEDVANGADYKTDSEFNARGAVYEYTVEANAETRKVTLTVSPVAAAVKAPDALSKSLKPGGYTKAEVDAWLPEKITVTYTGTDGYAQRTEGRAVTWDTDALGAGFGASAGSKTISGTVDLPAWATGENKVSIGVKFVDRQTLADGQMQLSISGWAYGAQTAPEPEGSVTVTDTEQAYTYSYSADGGASWMTAAGLPKSASGHIIPGDYLVEMAYTGRNYTGTKRAAFTVAQKPVTAEKGTLAVEDRNYDGTQNATLKAGGKPALSGVFANDDVSLSGTLKAVFTGKGPKKNIPVTVTGFALAGKDAGYYKLINTTLTLKATINNKDGSSPSSGSGSSDSGNSGGSGNNSGGSGNSGSGNSGNTGTGGNNGTGGNTGNGGNSSNNGGNGGNTGGSNKGTGSTGKGSTGSDSTGGTGKSSTIGTGKGSTGTGSTSGTGKGTSGTGKGNTGSGITGGIDKGSAGTGSGSTNGTGKSSAGNGNGSTNGTGKDSVGSGSGSNGGTGNGEAGARQADDGQQAKTVTVQTVQAETNDGRIVLPDGTEAPVAIGNLAEDAPGATRLMVGEGTVTVTVVCEDDQYTVGMNDATAVANAVLTPEQVQLVDSGERLEVRVDIKNIAQSISPQDRETVEKGFEAYRKYIPELVRGGYVDISVYTKTGDGGWNAVAETVEPLEVVIGIPEELLGDGREYYVIRAHEGRYALLNDMDAVPETVTIVTDQFSSYAIAYREAGAARAGNGETAYGLSHIPPKFLGIVCLICLTAVVAGIIIVVIVLRRKKGYKRENG